MFFKQVQLFQFTKPFNFNKETLIERIEPLAFTPCQPSMPLSMGWVPPIDEPERALVESINGCFMLCLQIEEKILPASVVNQAVNEKIKKIESNEDRKVRQKEKLRYKDEMTFSLLPRAFTKLSKIYGMIDARNGWLLINSTSQAKAVSFISLLVKSIGDIVEGISLKPSYILTHWLQHNSNPRNFAIEKACVLQDPDQQSRVVRCKDQDLFTNGLQTVLKEGFHVKQIALTWQDRLQFTIADNFTFSSIRLTEMVDMEEEIETKDQKFITDFLLMSDMFTDWIKDLLQVFDTQDESKLALAS